MTTGAALLRFLVGDTQVDGPSAQTWRDWLAFAKSQRLIPVLFHMAEARAGDLANEQLDELHEAQLAAMSVAASYDRHLVATAELLASEHVTFVALKGAATANLDYPDPSWRQYGDLDILVDRDDLPAARSALLQSGWREWYVIPHGHEPFTHAVTLTRRGRWELDVHQRIAHRAVGLRIPTSDLLGNRVNFHVGGVEVSALSAEDRLIHAAVHADMSRLESRRLSSVADVLLLATSQAALAPQVLDRAEQWRIRPLVERAIQTGFRTANLALPIDWSQAMARPIRSRDRLIEAAYSGGRRRPALEELAHLRLMSGWGERSQYLRSFLLAGDDYARRNDRYGPVAQGRYLISRLRDRRVDS